MTSKAFKAALEEAKTELSEAIANRDYWNIEIARLEQLVKSLSASLKKEPPSAPTSVGFTDVVISVLPVGGDEGMSAAEVRDALLKRGYDVGDYANPLAMIHQSLKRAAKARRIHETAKGRYGRSNLEATIFPTYR